MTIQRIVGFIGMGNMASAIASGMIQSGFALPQNILAFDKDQEKLHAFCAAHGIREALSNEDIVRLADVVVLAIKPNMFASVLPPLREVAAEKRPLFVSIAAGTPLQRIESLLGTLPVVRVLPNVNAQVGAGMAALCRNEHATPEDLDYVESLFDSLGKTVRIEERLFGIFSAVAGASPAFTFMFIEGLARGGLKAGMTKQQAVMAAAQAVMGSAKLVLESQQAPSVLVDTVCSPGGTTIAGVAALEENAFVGAVMQAVEAADQRDKELAEGKS